MTQPPALMAVRALETEKTGATSAYVANIYQMKTARMVCTVTSAILVYQ